MPTHNQFFIDPATNQPSPNSLQSVGPVLQVEIAVHPTLAQHLQNLGQPIPTPVVGPGLIDTGATFSAVDQTVIQQLGIPPIGTVQLGTAGGPVTQTQHPASFGFPGTGLPTISFNFVTGVDLTGQNIVALIGRDVLRHFVMVYNGSLGQVILSI